MTRGTVKPIKGTLTRSPAPRSKTLRPDQEKRSMTRRLCAKDPSPHEREPRQTRAEKQKRARDGGRGGFARHGKVLQGRGGEARKRPIVGEIVRSKLGPGRAVELPYSPGRSTNFGPRPRKVRGRRGCPRCNLWCRQSPGAQDPLACGKIALQAAQLTATADGARGGGETP